MLFSIRVTVMKRALIACGVFAFASAFLAAGPAAIAQAQGKGSKDYKSLAPKLGGGAKGGAKGADSGALTIGRTSEGVLEATDETFPDDGTFYDVWTFEGKEGDVAVVRMSATGYTPCIAVFLAGSLPIGIDGQCEDTTLFVTLPKTGTYLVAPNTANPGDSGPYKVRVDMLPEL